MIANVTEISTSERTRQLHLHKVYAKLDVTSRTRTCGLDLGDHRVG